MTLLQYTYSSFIVNRYTLEERAEMVILFVKNNESVISTQRFHAKFILTVLLQLERQYAVYLNNFDVARQRPMQGILDDRELDALLKISGV